MSTSRLLGSLFDNKAWADEALFAAVRAIDETANPTERHTAIRWLNHIHVVDQIFAGKLPSMSHGHSATNTQDTPSFEKLQEAVRATDRWYADYVRSVSAETLSESLEFGFTDGQNGRMSREEMLVHVVTHGSYHRGAVGRVMAQLSIAPPRDTFTVYVHKTEPERRQRS